MAANLSTPPLAVGRGPAARTRVECVDAAGSPTSESSTRQWSESATLSVTGSSPRPGFSVASLLDAASHGSRRVSRAPAGGSESGAPAGGTAVP